MSKTYCSCVGCRGVATRCGSGDGCRASVQAYDGSVIINNWYDQDEKLRVSVGTNRGSSSCADSSSPTFYGSFEDFKELLKLAQDIKEGKVSVVRHRAKSNIELHSEKVQAAILRDLEKK